MLAHRTRGANRAHEPRRHRSPPQPSHDSDNNDSDDELPHHHCELKPRRLRDRRQQDDRRPDPRATSRRDIKVKFDYFEGTYYPLVFLEWMQTTEHTLRHYRFEQDEVVNVVTLHFLGAARTWWPTATVVIFHQFGSGTNSSMS